MKTATKTSDTLKSKIKETSEAINSKSQELVELQKQLEAFEVSNINLTILVSQEIKNDAGLSPVEILAEIERLEGLENARIAKLANVRTATERFKLNVESVQKDLKNLEKQLQILEDEQDWQLNYLPLVDKYSTTFISEERLKNDKKILDCQQQITSLSEKIGKIEYFLNNPDPNQKLKACRITATESLSYPECEQALISYPERIQSLEIQIERHQDYLSDYLENLEKQLEYRTFIRARVDIENAAKQLENASKVYLDALADFKALEAQCKPCIRFAKDSGYSQNRIRSVEIGDYIEITDVLI